MTIDYIHEKPAWVCIIEYPDKAYHILTTIKPMDLAKSLYQPSTVSTGRLIYFRRFCDITNAQMHELVLNRISQKSLKATICRENPQMEDLTEELLFQFQ